MDEQTLNIEISAKMVSLNYGALLWDLPKFYNITTFQISVIVYMYIYIHSIGKGTIYPESGLQKCFTFRVE